ncbi:GNAT family N-acetyltransferase [Bacillus sp. DNRA2]|uniref:GNAT family N-acetyltransferase n=1 Tax=Bacillus sp. DNRA2 TaxID=2723053 RepID=UPI00145C9A62|nr:GNAT family N-acetyltransferase [Bacillus sp. DNRA2]NMD70992.1 GNAT family N-acetyltransferase [Bacillus sp. DNRA2]
MNKISPEQITISELDDNDKEAVRQLLIESYRQYEPEYSSPQIWEEYLADMIASVNSRDVDKIFVAKNHHHILGTLQLFRNSEKAYGMPELGISAPIIRLLGVHPKARGFGVAQKLLKASIEYAKDQGAVSIYLHSSDKMSKAISLYKWFGFIRDQSKDFNKHDIYVKCLRLDL